MSVHKRNSIGSVPISVFDVGSFHLLVWRVFVISGKHTTFRLPGPSTLSSHFIRIITKCDISNHKNLQEYGDDFIKARDKIDELGQPVPALLLLRTFLDGLDESYQSWKKRFLRRDVTKDITDSGVTTRKTVMPDAEQIIKGADGPRRQHGSISNHKVRQVTIRSKRGTEPPRKKSPEARVIRSLRIRLIPPNTS